MSSRVNVDEKTRNVMRDSRIVMRDLERLLASILAAGPEFYRRFLQELGTPEPEEGREEGKRTEEEIQEEDEENVTQALTENSITRIRTALSRTIRALNPRPGRISRLTTKPQESYYYY